MKTGIKLIHPIYMTDVYLNRIVTVLSSHACFICSQTQRMTLNKVPRKRTVPRQTRLFPCTVETAMKRCTVEATPTQDKACIC